ncbi:type IV secretory system conjugative DNA transfer family protein [Ralstonia insidiosa]|uniref:Type IV secretory system conjugative DNA transfer family protein n=1 Tax=Ralstonia insidiosa TaxID=190721 RepID=A0A848NX86_9RALS|nr:type IV secretory system conjugative DNA transfer family protein [Ralstonia insidiosa]NMV39931.1 type IV secretory system conjugative DNA transfer family protein [Ralstonia insidiosa]
MIQTGKRNQAVRLSISVFFVFALCVMATCWIATQYLAALLLYQPGLGEPVVAFRSGVKIYQPFSSWVWSWRWMNETGRLQDFVIRTQIIHVAGMFVSILVGFYLWYRRSLNSETPEGLHGSARFATYKEVQKMNFVSYEMKKGSWPFYRRVSYTASGVYIGAFDTPDGRKVIRYDEPAHVLVFAPSRSGKGVGQVLPTLLSYPHSTATNDIKGENFELSSGFRHSAGSLVIRFDPTSTDGRSIDGRTPSRVACAWNICEEIRDYPYDVQDAQNVSAIIADAKDEGIGSDHWISTSWGLIAGLILHCKYAERDKSLTGAFNYLTDPTFEDSEQMLMGLLNAEHDPMGRFGWTDSSGQPTKVHPIVAAVARANLNREAKERASVLSTAETKLALYQDPVIARNTKRSDFRIADLMNHEKPVSLYLVVPPSDKARLQPLLRLFFTYLIRLLTQKMEFADGESVRSFRHRLLLLIDELPTLGKMSQLQEGLGYIAGYGITAFLFVQDTIQLEDVYGENQTITSGCQVRVAYAPNTLRTAKDISAMTGVTTVKRQTVNYSGKRMAATLDQMSVSEELVERPLMTDEEVMRLPRDELLIFNAGHHPIRGKKLRYFEMAEFKRRAAMESPTRVEIAIRENGRIRTHWFMVQCEPLDKGAIKVCINAYDTFPPVSITVKQESPDLQTDVVQEFDYVLTKGDGKEFAQELTLDDTHFVAVPRDGRAQLDPREYFEVHFALQDGAGVAESKIAGFGRRLSDYEREARKLVKEHYYKVEEDTGKVADIRLERAEQDCRYRGVVLLATSHYVAVERVADPGAVSLHRIARLSRVPKTGESVSIRYTGKQGAVA